MSDLHAHLHSEIQDLYRRMNSLGMNEMGKLYSTTKTIKSTWTNDEKKRLMYYVRRIPRFREKIQRILSTIPSILGVYKSIDNGGRLHLWAEDVLTNVAQRADLEMRLMDLYEPVFMEWSQKVFGKKRLANLLDQNEYRSPASSKRARRTHVPGNRGKRESNDPAQSTAKRPRTMNL